MVAPRSGVQGPVPPSALAHRIGGWLPQDEGLIRSHVSAVLKRAKREDLPFVEPMVELRNLINESPNVYMLFHEMLTEVPTIPPYNKDPSGAWEIRNIPDLLAAINNQIQTSISYNDSPQIGTPINAILDWPMGTKAGFAAFVRDDVNHVFRKILQYWGWFLRTPAAGVSAASASNSTVTTEDGGWLSATAQNDPSSPGLANFLQTYVVPDPSDSIHYGFTNWDQFFIRKFKPGLRPVASPDDDSVIALAAECTPFYIQKNVQNRDTFWAKNSDGRTNYSLAHMLGDDEMAKHFKGGTVFQAFLSADSYHNWHAPVSGSYVKQPMVIPGTYYSEPLLWGFSPDDPVTANPDSGADELSQSYIANNAARGVAFIQADNPEIGLMAIVMVGMAEVSSIEFDPLSGFTKGQEIGRFHFGGSTHCLVFRPGVNLKFADAAVPAPDVTKPGSRVHVSSELARVA